jgi:hypothetical protein
MLCSAGNFEIFEKNKLFYVILRKFYFYFFHGHFILFFQLTRKTDEIYVKSSKIDKTFGILLFT